MEKILIIGATSAIAEACARKFAIEGKTLFIYGRNIKRLDKIKKDLSVRGAKNVFSNTFRAENHLEEAINMIDNAHNKLNGFDTAILAHGILPDQQDCEKSNVQTHEVLKINFLSMVSYLTALGKYFKEKSAGTIVVFSSVAGDRARRSNYIYGTSKGALSLFCQGLRNYLDQYGVNVLTIKPGFVDTPMTIKYEKKGLLWAKPDKIAQDIITGIIRKKTVVYTPWYWYWIMSLINMIPESIFKRMKL